MGLGQSIVCQDDGVKGIACGKARLFAKVGGAGGGTQIPALGDGQEGSLLAVHHVADLGGANGRGDHIEHIQVVAAGDVAAKGYLHAFVQHDPHRRSAGADIYIGISTIDHGNAGVLHGLALPLIGPDAVRHDGAGIPEAKLGIGLPVLLAVGVKLADPFNLLVVFREVGLHGQIPLLRQLPQEGHQLIRAGGGEAGGQHGLDMLEILAAIQPAQRFGHGFLRRFFQNAGGVVAVHVDLAHVTDDAGLFQFVHQNERGVGVQGGEHADAGGTACNQLLGQSAIDFAGVGRVCEAGLCREGIGIQPVQQRQVHAGAQHGILGRVEVQVRKGL